MDTRGIRDILGAYAFRNLILDLGALACDVKVVMVMVDRTDPTPVRR